MTEVHDNSKSDQSIQAISDNPTDEPTLTTELIWDGRLDIHSDDEVALRHALADAAKSAKWGAVFDVLDTHPNALSPNTWRPGGHAWFTPLHQAAWHNAPQSVIEELVQRGAWLSLRTASGETAQDIAIKKGHSALCNSLTPRFPRRIDLDVYSKLDEQLTQLIESRIRPALDVRLRHPSCVVLAEHPDLPLWYPVPGMYGGFSIRLMRNYLFVESWCRVVGGSGQAHVVTAEGFTLVEEGFV